MMSPARAPILRLALVAVPTTALAIAALAYLRPERPMGAIDAVPAAAVPERIAVVIDSSASMKGYFTGKTAFKDTLATLIAVLPHSYDQPAATASAIASPAASDAGGPSGDATPAGPRLSYYFSRDEGLPLLPFEGTSAELTDMLLDDPVPRARSSFLQDMLAQLQQVLNKEPGAVGIIITDGLMSFPNKRVAEDAEITRDSLKVLAAKVHDALAPAGWTPDLQFSVLQYVSAFNGVYYTYRNEAIELTGRDRPFYLWLVGHADRVDAVVKVLRRHRDLRPVHEIAMPQRAKVNPRVLGYSDRGGTWFRDRTDRLTLRKVKAFDGRDVKFQIALDLPDVSADVASLAHLTNHLRIETHLVDADVQVRTSVARHVEDAAELEHATHFIEVRARGLQANEGRVRIVLPNVLPDWCGEGSSDDDHDVQDEERPRTFGLLPLLEGAAMAFRLDRQPVFQFAVTLRR